MGGGKRTRERALPKIFGPLQKSFWSILSWIFVQEKQSTDTWGGWKTYRTRGGPKPLFGRGVIRWGFPPPSFFHPPMASSERSTDATLGLASVSAAQPSFWVRRASKLPSNLFSEALSMEPFFKNTYPESLYRVSFWQYRGVLPRHSALATGDLVEATSTISRLFFTTHFEASILAFTQHTITKTLFAFSYNILFPETMRLWRLYVAPIGPPFLPRVVAINDHQSDKWLYSPPLMTVKQTSRQHFGAPQKLAADKKHPKTQHTQKHRKSLFRKSAFQVCCVFGCFLFPSKRVPKHDRKCRFSERWLFCVFGCVAFSGAFGLSWKRACHLCCHKLKSLTWSQTGNNQVDHGHSGIKTHLGHHRNTLSN